LLFNYLLINVFPFSLMLTILIELKANNHPRIDYRYMVTAIVLTMAGVCFSSLLYLCAYFRMEGGWLDLFNYAFVIVMLESPLVGISGVLYFYQKAFGLEKLKRDFRPLHIALLIPYFLYIFAGAILLKRAGLLESMAEVYNGHFVDVYFKALLYLYAFTIIGVLVVARHVTKTIKRNEYANNMFAMAVLIVGTVLDSISASLMLEWGFFAASYWIIFVFNYERHISSDALTGAYNRQSYDLMLSKLWSDLNPEERKSAFLFMIDCDNFKHINDVYGHATGDEALRILSRDIEYAIRPYEAFFSRFGGDEFNIIITGVSEATVQAIRHEIKVNLTRISLSSSFSYPLTCSVGICSFADVISVAELKQKADSAMYRDKKFKKVIEC
jgi:diguanylate cyclase (GGDEF) domain